MTIKKYLVTVDTNYWAESQIYSAIVDDENFVDFEQYCNSLAYDKFSDFNGFNNMMEELFGEPEGEDGEYSKEQLEKGYQEECNYYSYTINEFEDDEEDWNWYDLIWNDSK